MTSLLNAETCRARAHQWQAEAYSLFDGPQKETCWALAKGYAELAALLVATRLSRPTTSAKV